MAQNLHSIAYQNVLAWRGCEKLYLDIRTCDVFFVFDTELGETHRIPGHKSILSAISPMFDAMFYGPLKKDGDINIVDASANAFKEFLQFFYLSTVKLTVENVSDVMNLGKEYLIDACFNACTDLCKLTITPENVCWGYELAILFDQSDLKRICERKLRDHPKEVFQSSSFLNCQSNVVRHILQLNSLNSDEVFDGCLAWAKSTCIRKGANENDAQNLRSELGDLFYEIRFDEMQPKWFHDRYCLHKGFFSKDEFIDISMMIADKAFQSTKFKRSAVPFKSVVDSEHDRNVSELICERRSTDDSKCNLEKLVRNTMFRSNHALSLKRLHFRKLEKESGPMDVQIRINENPSEDYSGNLCASLQAHLNNSGETVVELQTPVAIKPGVMYEIRFVPIGRIFHCCGNIIRNEVHMQQGIIVTFHDTKECQNGSGKFYHELIARMDFDIFQAD